MTTVDSMAPVADRKTSASQGQGGPNKGLKLTDLCGVIYLAGISAIIFLNVQTVMALTKAHPLPMSFIKFALLATFGECLKTRIDTGGWFPKRLLLRACSWGVFGMWISLCFPFMVGGVDELIKVGEWPAQFKVVSLVLWLNYLGGYAFFMMLTHYWADSMIARGPMWPWAVFGNPGSARWCKIVWCAITFFWNPVHIVTFSLPPIWRTLWAAYVSMAFGLILSFAAGRKTSQA
ncbi:MAG: hypothetical protein P4M01_01780 [Acidobacteriota bacterium]|nr:hypothetical protein [Acidobacteriota bacterium]